MWYTLNAGIYSNNLNSMYASDGVWKADTVGVIIEILVCCGIFFLIFSAGSNDGNIDWSATAIIPFSISSNMCGINPIIPVSASYSMTISEKISIDVATLASFCSVSLSSLSTFCSVALTSASSEYNFDILLAWSVNDEMMPLVFVKTSSISF